MGQSLGCSNARDNSRDLTKCKFSLKMQGDLERTFEKLSIQDKVSKKQSTIKQEFFKRYLIECPFFATRLYEFMKFYSKKVQVDYYSFMHSIESIYFAEEHCLEPEGNSRSSSNKYKKIEEKKFEGLSKFSRIELILLIASKTGPNEFNVRDVSQAEAKKILRTILSIMNQRPEHELPHDHLNDISHSILNLIKLENMDIYATIRLSKIADTVKQIMPCFEKKMNEWISYKFFGGPLIHNIPFWRDSSQILKDEIVTAMNLIFPFELNATFAHLAYASTDENFDFKEFSSRLKIINDRFLVLFKLKQTNKRGSPHKIGRRNADGPREEKPAIIGAFCPVPIVDGYNYFGNNNAFIFSLYPTLRVYYPRNEEHSGSNFIYFQSKSLEKDRISFSSHSMGTLVNKLGLGFGGRTPETCRIWIDSDIKDKSFVNSENDDTFCPGPLVNGEPNGKIEIEDIEVWQFTNSSDNEEFKAKISEHMELENQPATLQKHATFSEGTNKQESKGSSQYPVMELMKNRSNPPAKISVFSNIKNEHDNGLITKPGFIGESSVFEEEQEEPQEMYNNCADIRLPNRKAKLVKLGSEIVNNLSVFLKEESPKDSSTNIDGIEQSQPNLFMMDSMMPKEEEHKVVGMFESLAPTNKKPKDIDRDGFMKVRSDIDEEEMDRIMQKYQTTSQ